MGAEEEAKILVYPPEPPTFSIPRDLGTGGQWMCQQLSLVGEVIE